MNLLGLGITAISICLEKYYPVYIYVTKKLSRKLTCKLSTLNVENTSIFCFDRLFLD